MDVKEVDEVPDVEEEELEAPLEEVVELDVTEVVELDVTEVDSALDVIEVGAELILELDAALEEGDMLANVLELDGISKLVSNASSADGPVVDSPVGLQHLINEKSLNFWRDSYLAWGFLRILRGHGCESFQLSMWCRARRAGAFSF